MSNKPKWYDRLKRDLLVKNIKSQDIVDDVNTALDEYDRLIGERSEYTKMGGNWLGAARNWVQWNCRNGEFVTWGTHDVLEPPLTIRQVEDLASRVADAANEEADDMKRCYKELGHRRLKSEIELTFRAERAEKEVERLKAQLTRGVEAIQRGMACEQREKAWDALRPFLAALESGDEQEQTCTACGGLPGESDGSCARCVNMLTAETEREINGM